MAKPLADVPARRLDLSSGAIDHNNTERHVIHVPHHVCQASFINARVHARVQVRVYMYYAHASTCTRTSTRIYERVRSPMYNMLPRINMAGEYYHSWVRTANWLIGHNHQWLKTFTKICSNHVYVPVFSMPNTTLLFYAINLHYHTTPLRLTTTPAQPSTTHDAVCRAWRQQRWSFP